MARRNRSNPHPQHDASVPVPGNIRFPLYALRIEGGSTIFQFRDDWGPGPILASSVEGIQAAAEVVADLFPDECGKRVFAAKIATLDALIALRQRIEAQISTRGFYFNLRYPGPVFAFVRWVSLMPAASQN
jgi:hypothetical protein